MNTDVELLLIDQHYCEECEKWYDGDECHYVRCGSSEEPCYALCCLEGHQLEEN